MSNTEATARPWRVEEGQQIYSGERGVVWVSGDKTTNAEDEANAALIVRAVNSFDALVEALRNTRIELGRLHSVHFAQFEGKIGLPDADVITQADAALKLAEGKPRHPGIIQFEKSTTSQPIRGKRSVAGSIICKRTGKSRKS